MAVSIIMPKQGQSVETCIIAEIKKKGDKVKKGEVIFSYETDKASFEEVSPQDGTVLECFYSEGDEVPVLQNVMIIGEPGENYSDLLAQTDIPAAEVEKETQQAIAKVENSPEQPALTELQPNKNNAPVSPRARHLAEKEAIETSALAGSGPNGRIIEKDVRSALENRPKLTPLAKKLAAEEGLQPTTSGSGLNGMAKSIDLSAPTNAVYGLDYEDRKLPNIRKLIAKSMQASLQNSAQLTHHLGADARRILQLRKKAKAAFESGQLQVNITLNDFVCFAVIKALQKFPNVNSHFLGDSIRYFKKIHLGLA
ncbi:MAG TPA: 2-oxo acid dehydrogenase subunit E2, partial [Dysgonamonadaceae bacterium]|nr:2-oxo acid dehydrogenase subunit E2 [Dysgonamonadaceae bacterium]